MENKLFNKSSMERIASPEKLNDYIRVANPSIWMALAAIGLLLAALLVWGFFGSVTTTTAIRGVVTSDGTALCYIDANSGLRIEEGMPAAIAVSAEMSVTGKVTQVSAKPISHSSAESHLMEKTKEPALDDAANAENQEYYLYSLSIADWNTEIVLTLDEGAELEPGIYTLSITTESKRPIEMIFSN